MHWPVNELRVALAAGDVLAWAAGTIAIVKVLIGFSLIIFVHELGHFLAAKWVGVRVDRFAIGFGYRLFGWRRGEGLTIGSRPSISAEELQQRGWGETDYCFKVLPLGGYVKMLGQEDIQINEETGDIKMSDDPRAFTNKPVRKRMIVVSAGVIFNLLFAILGFMWVFMLGKQEPAPQLGELDPIGPAARAGLRAGDIVLRANSRRVDSFRDILIAQITSADGEVRFVVERDGQELPEELVMQVDPNEEDPLVAGGLTVFGTTELLTSGLPAGDLPALQPGDRITHVGRQEVHTGPEVDLAITRHITATGDPLIELTVQRPDPHDRGSSAPTTCYYRDGLLVISTVTGGAGGVRVDAGDILGFVQRRKVAFVDPGKPGDQAGLKPGDVILRWGDVPHPVYEEIVASVKSNPGREVPVIVERNGQTVALKVISQRPFRLFGTAKPKVGVAFSRVEEERAVVADVLPDTPAAALNIPRGAVIRALDGEAVNDWFDVVRLLKASAGRTITASYEHGTIEAEGTMSVPSSLINELGLPPEALILSINGEVRAALDNGLTVRLPHPLAVRALLKKHAGQTVTVGYRLWLGDPEDHQAEFAVRADLSNVAPWQMQIYYSHSLDLRFAPKQKLVKTSNPLVAAYLGLKHTGLVLVEVYRVIKMITRNLLSARTGSVRHVSGPVGIIGHAIERAKMGFPELLFFLAFLSVNLAVINFIPIPLVDGGLMVFLIIERIRGKPLGLKTQMITTLIGLAAIVLTFLFITIQDITKFFG